MDDVPGSSQDQAISKLPEITRKITACAACRKQKIKCHMRDGPPCSRCQKRGLPCTVNRSLQMLLESDATWKVSIERKLERLEAAQSSGPLSLPNATLHEDADPAMHQMTSSGSMEQNACSPATLNASYQLQQWNVVMDPDAGPGAMPGSVISPVATPLLTGQKQDIIARGVITIKEAQSFLDKYQNRLDHFVYGIVGARRTLDEIRACPLLLTAICAVGSLHHASTQFDRLYQEFVSQASAQMFSQRPTVDDVRGLCIGAFWLSGISWACIGAAVRISTEIQLHRSIFKALEGSETHYLHTRLYYLVFVCDHQFSIPYGRPPMTAECESIRANTAFLETRFAVEDDFRLVSQLRLWQIGAEVFDYFGVNVDRPLTLSMIEPLRRFSIRFDQIRTEWSQRFVQNQYVGDYPRKGVGLHSHFIKLYLLCHVFRGVGKPGFDDPDVSLDIHELAAAAMLAATSILRAVVYDASIQDYLNGLPTYFDLMIAFAVVFVLKVSTNHANLVHNDATEARNLVLSLVGVLQRITTTMHSRHLLASVARGSEALLRSCGQSETTAVPPEGPSTHDALLFDWEDTSMGSFSMEDFDFLSHQDLFPA